MSAPGTGASGASARGEEGSPGPSPPVPRRTRSAATPLFWLVLLVAAYFIPRGQYPNPDSHLALGYAMVERHTLRIDNYLQLSGSRQLLLDKAVYCGAHTDVRTCRHYYSDKAPGVGLLIAGVYQAVHPVISSGMAPTKSGSDRFLLRLLLTLLVISLPVAAFTVAYWRFLARYAGPTRAMLVTVGYAFGSIALPYSMLLFSHALSAALLFGAFMLVAPRPSVLEAARGTRAPARALLAGALAGYAIGCEYPAAIIVALIGLYLLFGHGGSGIRLRSTSRYACGVLIGTIPLLLYNLAAFGTPLAQGYAYLNNPLYARGMAHGIMGVGAPMWEAALGTTFSPYRGIFLLSPWLLLAFPGLAGMAKAGWRREAWLCGSVSVAYFLFQAGYAFWDGGASVGPRHFLPALPFLAFPVVFALGDRRLLRLAQVLIAVSVAEMLLIVSVRPWFGTSPIPFVDETLHFAASGQWQNNWGQLFRLPGPASLLPLLAIAFILARRIRGRLRSGRAVWGSVPLP